MELFSIRYRSESARQLAGGGRHTAGRSGVCAQCRGSGTALPLGFACPGLAATTSLVFHAGQLQRAKKQNIRISIACSHFARES